MTTNRLVYIVNLEFLDNNPNLFLQFSKLEYQTNNTYKKVFIPKIALACTAYKRIITNYYTSPIEQTLRINALHTGTPITLSSEEVTLLESEVGLDVEDLYNALEFAEQSESIIDASNIIGRMVQAGEVDYPEGLSFSTLMKNFKADNLSVFYQDPY